MLHSRQEGASDGTDETRSSMQVFGTVSVPWRCFSRRILLHPFLVSFEKTVLYTTKGKWLTIFAVFWFSFTIFTFFCSFFCSCLFSHCLNNSFVDFAFLEALVSYFAWLTNYFSLHRGCNLKLFCAFHSTFPVGLCLISLQLLTVLLRAPVFVTILRQVTLPLRHVYCFSKCRQFLSAFPPSFSTSIVLFASFICSHSLCS